MTDEVLLDKIEKIIDKRALESEQKFEKRFETIETQLRAIRKQQDQDREDFTSFFHDAGIFFDEMRNELLIRIEGIEDRLNLLKN